MKRFILLIILSILLLSGCSSHTIKTTTTKDGISISGPYLKNGTMDGEFTFTDTDGTIKKVNIINDIMSGTMTVYFPEGIKSYGPFHEEKGEFGIRIIEDKNGTRSQGLLEQGEKEGKWITKDKEGNISETYYKDNEIVGTIKKTGIDENGDYYESYMDKGDQNGTVIMTMGKTQSKVKGIVKNGKVIKTTLIDKGNFFSKNIYVKYRGKLNVSSENFVGGKVNDTVGKVKELYYDSNNKYMIILLNKTYYQYCGIGLQTRGLIYNSNSKYGIYESLFYGSYDCRNGFVPSY